MNNPYSYYSYGYPYPHPKYQAVPPYNATDDGHVHQPYPHYDYPYPAPITLLPPLYYYQQNYGTNTGRILASIIISSATGNINWCFFNLFPFL